MITKEGLEKQAQTMGYLPLEWKKGDPLPKWVPLNTALAMLEELPDYVETCVNSFSSVDDDGCQWMSAIDYRLFLTELHRRRNEIST